MGEAFYKALSGGDASLAVYISHALGVCKDFAPQYSDLAANSLRDLTNNFGMREQTLSSVLKSLPADFSPLRGVRFAEYHGVVGELHPDDVFSDAPSSQMETQYS